MQMLISRPVLDAVPPPHSEMEGYMPAGQRSGAHADSVWPYLEESRRQVATQSPPAEPVQPPRSPTSLRKVLAYLRGDPEVS